MIILCHDLWKNKIIEVENVRHVAVFDHREYALCRAEKCSFFLILGFYFKLLHFLQSIDSFIGISMGF
jgi:hypothetical protein